MGRSVTTELTKDGVTYELEISIERSGTINIESVVILNGIGVQRVETEIDPEEFAVKLRDHEWEGLREMFE